MRRILLAITVICALLAGCNTNAKDIGEKRAKEIALENIPEANVSDIRKFEKDYDDGKLYYEGKVVLGNTEYEFEIDASNGDVVKWEKDSVFD